MYFLVIHIENGKLIDYCSLDKKTAYNYAKKYNGVVVYCQWIDRHPFDNIEML